MTTRPVPENVPSATQRRQRRTVTILATALLIGGAVVLCLLKRMPLPLRILVGLTDLVGGAVLLVVARQKFR